MSTRLPTRAAICLAAALLLAGCGTGGASDQDAVDPVTDKTSAPTGDKTPTGSAPTTPTSPAPPGLETRLLSAEELPGVNEVTEWSVSGTDTEDGAGHGSCQKFSLVDIGAQTSLVRSYAASGDVTAIQVLGEFADPKSAWRAHQVLKTWASECAEMLDAEVEKVSGLTPVPVPGGIAQQQLLQYGDEGAEAHTFSGVAITRRGSYLSIVQIDVVGQDYNYDPGDEPASLAAVAANQKLA
jgi:hypothetical protein